MKRPGLLTGMMLTLFLSASTWLASTMAIHATEISRLDPIQIFGDASAASILPSLANSKRSSVGNALQPIVVAQASCRACGARSRSCHAPCKRMSGGPQKGACHASCKSKYSRCKASCTKSAKGRKKGGKKVTVSVDLSGKSRTKKVSAAQAKKIAVSKRNHAVAATPPNIADITAILREQKPVDAKAVAKSRKEAARKPPKTKSKSKLAKFYHQRGIAAGKIGKTEQQLSDLRKALAFGKSGARDFRRLVHWDLANALGAFGLFRESLDHRLASYKLVPKTITGRRIGYGSIIAAVYLQLGRLGDAERQMASVARIFRQPQNANAYKKYGRVWKSRAMFSQAALFEAKGAYDKAENIYLQTIDLSEAHIRANKSLARQSNESLFLQVQRTRLSRILEQQGRIVEAELMIRKALLDRLKATGLYSTWTPRIVIRFAEHLALQGRYEESLQLINVAVDVMNRLGFTDDTLRVVKAKLLLARIKFLTGNIDESLAIYDELKRSAEDRSKPYKRLIAKDIDRALALAMSDRYEEIIAEIRSLEIVKAKPGARTPHSATVSVKRGAFAIALAKSGDLEGAYREFRNIVPKLISLSDSEADEEYTLGTAREHRKSIILDAYLGLLADIRGTPLEDKLGIDAAADAFQIADVARGQLVQKAVSAASARASVNNKKLAELVRTEQDTRKRLTALSGVLAGVLATPSDQQDAKAVKDLNNNISKLQKALKALFADIKKKFPDYAALLNPQAPSIEDIQSALQEGEAFVSIFLGQERSYVWALPKSGDLAFHASKLTRLRAKKFVQALRGALNPQVATLGDIPDFDVRIAHKLYQQILQPVEAGWQDATSLLVSTNGALGQLPLTVLVTEKARLKDADGPLFAGYRDIKWLARSHAMTLLPSAATLVTLRSIPQGNQSRKPFIGFGNPLFNQDHAKRKKAAPKQVADALKARGALRTRGLPVRLRSAPKTDGDKQSEFSNLPPLPDTADEVRSIAVAMKADLSAALQLGIKANEDTIRNQDLSGYKVIAFATHGLIPGDLSGLREPALALSAPKLAKAQGDGLLTMSEIMALKLDADWVVLSACNTGSGRGAGAEAVSGLGRAFFYAGTRALLVSSWPVETTSARLLTTDIFERLTKEKKLSRAGALQQAISALIDKPGQKDVETKETLFYYAHPIFWAPFILVGDGGTTDAKL